MAAASPSCSTAALSHGAWCVFARNDAIAALPILRTSHTCTKGQSTSAAGGTGAARLDLTYHSCARLHAHAWARRRSRGRTRAGQHPPMLSFVATRCTKKVCNCLRPRVLLDEIRAAQVRSGELDRLLHVAARCKFQCGACCNMLYCVAPNGSCCAVG
jgi:hypothetical protein